MRNILITLFIFFNQMSWSQNISFDWNKIIGKTGNNSGNCIKVDTSGYIYTSGYFSDSINFLGEYLKSKGNLDSYLAKMDSNGNLIWLKQFSGIYNDRITSLQIDKDNYVYICGSYKVKLSFDTILTTNNKDTLYSSNMFLAKYNSSGKLSWAINTGGVDFAGNKINIDNHKNIIITGKSIDINKFDTTVQIQTMDSVEEPIPPKYGGGLNWRYFHPTNNFVAKYNTEGKKLWIKKIGGNPYSLKTDNKENIIITGNMEGSSAFFSFDSTIINSIGSETIFLAKYNKDGELLWAESAGGAANWNTGYDLAIDSINNIYITGQIFSGDIKFGNSISFNVIGENTLGFLAKCDSTGDFKWAKIIGTPTYNGFGTGVHYNDPGTFNSGNSLIIKYNEILLTGYFLDSINFNNSIVVSNRAYAMFLCKYDLNGNPIKAGTYICYSWVSGKELSIDNLKNIYVTGYTYLDGLDSRFPSFIYIAKINFDIPTIYIPPDIPLQIITSEIKDKNTLIYPNPCKDYVMITSNSVDTKFVQIISLNGMVLYSDKFTDNLKVVNMSSFQNGIYIIKIHENQNLMIKKIIKE